MTGEELQAIRERAEKATPGPWEPREKMAGDREYGCEIRGNVYRGTSSPVCSLSTGFVWYEDDKSFILHSRQDIPALLQEIERLQARVAELKEDIAIMRGEINDFEEEER